MRLCTYSSIKDIPKESWDALNCAQFPFECWRHLLALEESLCVGADIGWQPIYLTLWKQSELVGAIYLYAKNHSYGEYIFDWQWANLYEQLGQSYYPKLVSAMPFTPATGAKLRIKDNISKKEAAKLLLDECQKMMLGFGCQSLNFLFIEKDELELFEENGFATRHSLQFHWKNQNYDSFDDFVSKMKQKRRKEIIRERRKVNSHKLKFSILKKDEITEDIVRIFYKFYVRTNFKRGGYPYLNEIYFQKVFQELSDSVLLFVAEDGNEELVATSLCYKAEDKLYGRYWGAREDLDQLHFEMCYYSPIEYCIKNKIKIFEAGAQGPHKINRGFLPEYTYSAHLMRDERAANYIYEWIGIEKEEIRISLEGFSESSPFKQKKPRLKTLAPKY